MPIVFFLIQEVNAYFRNSYKPIAPRMKKKITSKFGLNRDFCHEVLEKLPFIIILQFHQVSAIVDARRRKSL